MNRDHDAASALQDLWVFGEYGDVNPSITDSSTYTFLSPDTMRERFSRDMAGCFLYSRQFNPTDRELDVALAAIEGTESAHVTASGMAAISSTILQLCKAGDTIVSDWTVYGGTYALLSNFLPRYGIRTSFVDITNLDMVRKAMTNTTRLLYCESISNPLLRVPDFRALRDLAGTIGARLVVDNTFSPLILSPHRFGADVVVHSLTKFMNGSSDCVAGAICASREFIDEVTGVNEGACMLLGPVLDSLRAASILKNLHHLHLRMPQHSRNAQCIAERLRHAGLKVHYPGLADHPQHQLLRSMMHPSYGFGGMLVLDLGTVEKADAAMVAFQEAKVGFLAVSLGYFRTLFSAPANSTSSEIPRERQQEMGLSDGMVRMSIGLDHDIERTWERIERSLRTVGVVS